MEHSDYLFDFFTGEGFEDGEQVHFTLSRDGSNWADLNNNRPVPASTAGLLIQSRAVVSST